MNSLDKQIKFIEEIAPFLQSVVKKYNLSLYDVKYVLIELAKEIENAQKAKEEADKPPKEPIQYNSYPVYGTQGGGLVRWDERNQNYVFVEKPDCPGLEVGDFMPIEWGLGGQANKPAEEEVSSSEVELILHIHENGLELSTDVDVHPLSQTEVDKLIDESARD